MQSSGDWIFLIDKNNPVVLQGETSAQKSMAAVESISGEGHREGTAVVL